MAKRINAKLTACFYSPFMTISKVGTIAYKLQLPETSQVHPVFHVSQLKKAIDTPTVQPTIPSEFEGDKPEWPLEGVLAYGTIQEHHSARPQVLIKRQSKPKEEAIWEDYSTIQTQFPT